MKREDLEKDLGPLDYNQMIINLKTISDALDRFSNDVYDMELDDISAKIIYYSDWIYQVKEALDLIYFEGEE